MKHVLTLLGDRNGFQCHTVASLSCASTRFVSVLHVVAVQMRLQSAVNVYGVNSVLFIMSEAHAVLPPQSHSLSAVLLDTLVFVLMGYLLPCWILYLNEVQARQRFLAVCQGLESEDLGTHWARQHLLGRRRDAGSAY